VDPIRNPFAPGAGAPPPELAGRDRLREDVRVALARIRRGRSAKSYVLVGLRGVGKTVLLDRMRADADSDGYLTIRLEVQEGRSLPSMLAPPLRLVLLRLSRVARAKTLAVRGLQALAGLTKSLKVKYGDIEVGFDFEPEKGLADNGDLESDLSVVLEQVGMAARDGKTAVVFFLDELQNVAEAQFSALIAALHRCAQQQLPVTVVGAGLPQLLALAGNAKSYAERLFEFPVIGPLTDQDARIALARPAEEENVHFEDAALQEILRYTHNYPYFLQEWGKHSWDVADQSPIRKRDVELATRTAIAALDESFFRMRFNRTSPKERLYLRAMADLGPGPHRSGDIAEVLGKKVTTVAPLRKSLTLKGMIWSPIHGDTAFTVPLFDEFMKRIMPGDNWRADLDR
jgi:hypothetical protein